MKSESRPTAINILWPLSAVAGYSQTFFDIIEADPRYYATGTAYPGDTFQQIRVEKDYRQNVASESFDYFIMSAGGNDFLGGGALRNLLRWREEGDGTDPTSHLNMSWLQMSLETLRAGYQEIADDVRSISGGKRTKMLVNTYDYPTPRPDGIWLGKPLIQKGYNLRTDKILIDKIMKHLVDSFYLTLRRVRHITVVDVRNTVKGRWTDELHPKKAGSIDVAKKFKAVMEA